MLNGRRPLLALAASTALALLLLDWLLGVPATRAGAPGRPMATVTISDDTVRLPATVQAGYASFVLFNAGSRSHDVSFVRLNPDVTLAQLTAAVQAAPGRAGFQAVQQLATSYGGAAGIAAGASVTVGLNLTPGDYAASTARNFAAGQVQAFTATAPASDAAPLLADVTVGMSDFAFDAPASVPAGHVTLQLGNSGQQPHELVLLQLDPGYSLADLLQHLQEPSPPVWVHQQTSWEVSAPGVNGALTLDLAPGTYSLLCFIPDPASGQPHVALGMASTFTAQ